MGVLRSGVAVLAAVFLVVACQSEDSPEPIGEKLDAPVAPGSGQPRLYTAADGTVWLSWLDPIDDSTHALRYATLTDTTWSAPTTVATGTDWFVNWADLPSVRPLPGGRAAAHYLQSNGASALAYGVRITQTTRDGTWPDAVTPHADDSPTEHGFVSMAPWPNDRMLAVWLDGRKMAGDGHGPGEMTLRSAVLDSAGRATRRAQIDGRTCECCATNVVRIGEEALVAYRDRSANEVRNIRVARFDGEEWSDPTLLHDDGWEIAGCPVNGPALAAQGDRVAAAWFTAAGGVPRVKAAFSTDGGRRFADPVVVAEGQTKGRVDAVLREDGAAVVSWLKQAGDHGRVQLRRVRSDSTMGAVFTLAELSSASRRVGFPKVVGTGDHLYSAWVESGPEPDAPHVRVARIDERILQ